MVDGVFSVDNSLEHMSTAIGSLLITFLYSAISFALWASLNRASVFLVVVAYIFSLITFVWVEGVFRSDDYDEPLALKKSLGDLRFSLPAALELPLPVLATGLSIIWLVEQKLQQGLISLAVATAMWLVVFCIWSHRRKAFQSRSNKNVL